MIARYSWAELTRNPRRTLSAAVGVTLGVGLTCSMLFLADGLSTAMTQRAIAPLPIDMQRIVDNPLAARMVLSQTIRPVAPTAGRRTVRVRLETTNHDVVPANEVTIRSRPPQGWRYAAGSARVDGRPVGSGSANPLYRPTTQLGLNLGSLSPGARHTITYDVVASTVGGRARPAVDSTVSTREDPDLIGPASHGRLDLRDLTTKIRRMPEVAYAEQLSFADRPSRALRVGRRAYAGPARVFAFDSSYRVHYPGITITEGVQRPGHVLLSVEAARATGAGRGDIVSVQLPDGTTMSAPVSGLVDLSLARSLFVSRLGSHLDVFQYVAASVVIDPATFADRVMPAFERAAAQPGSQVLSPPVREVDFRVRRGLLDGDPRTALHQTDAIAGTALELGHGQGRVLDNLSNTLQVARADADSGKQLFLVLGLPGGVLAAILATYAGGVLAAAQRDELMTLWTRGATARTLVRLLAARVGAIAIVGSIIGVAAGYASAAMVVGTAEMNRVAPARLAVSALVGMVIGLVGTGTALFVTGRRSIDHQLSHDLTDAATRAPRWRRFRLDIGAVVIVAGATVVAVHHHAFAGEPGSVYVARAVRLPLATLVLPLAAWLAGGLLAGRGFAWILRLHGRLRPSGFTRHRRHLYRLSIQRRSWAVAEASIVIGLIVALGIALAAFNASYVQASTADARYETGGDVRIAQTPGRGHPLRASDVERLRVSGLSAVTPVVYSTRNVIVRSKRTEDPMNLAAVDVRAYERIAPLRDDQFPGSSARKAMAALRRPDGVLLNVDQADFLQAEVGDEVEVLLARGTEHQVTTKLVVVGLFDRLPGFPDGADALMNIARHEHAVPTTIPDLFLAKTSDGSGSTLVRAVAAIRAGPGASGRLRIDTRSTVMAKDQSTLASLDLQGLVRIDTGYGIAAGAVAVAVFVFGLLLQRRREYVTLRAQGLHAASIRALIAAEAATAAVAGCVAGVLCGSVMGAYLVGVLHPLFVTAPRYRVPVGATIGVVGTVLCAAAIASIAASALVNRLNPTELLRDE